MELRTASVPSRGSPDVGSGVSPAVGGPAFGWGIAVAGAVVLLHLGVEAVGFGIPNPAAILVLAVVYASFTWGITAGFTAAAISAAYVAWHHLGHRPSGPAHQDVVRVVLWIVVFPMTALLVGMLERRARKVARLPAMEALRASQERYREFVSNSAVGVWMVEMNPPLRTDLPPDEQIALMYKHARMVECNDAMARMYGFERGEDLTGVGLADLMVPDDPKNMEYLRAFINSGYRLVDVESHERDRLGRDRYFSNSLMGKIDNGLTRAWGTQIDVTDRKLAEQRLERERGLFMKGPVVVFRWAAREGWPVEYVSANVREVFGYEAEEFTQGRVGYAAVVHPEDVARIHEEMRLHAVRGTMRYEQEYRIVRPDGGERWLLDFTQVVRDRAGRVTHHEGYVIDITERARAERERRELEERLRHTAKLESLGVLAGGVAHDFNNLLVGILGNAQMAMGQLPEDSVARERVATIELAAQRAAELTRQMLAYAGDERPVKEMVDVSAIVQEMTSLLTASISGRVRLVRDLDRGLPPVEGDATHIRQTVMNLVMNASDAADRSGGTVTVRTRAEMLRRSDVAQAAVGADAAEGPYIVIEVADTGTGMDEATRQRMFEPFFSTKFEGRGLGLSAVLGIVRSHHGAITVESEVGRGTTIRIWLPVKAEPAVVVRVASMSSAVGPALAPVVREPSSGLVLVVDDEPFVRDLASVALTSSGYSVLSAEGGARALDLFRQHHHELRVVLLDVMMPDMAGEEVLERMRELDPEVPVILTSGYVPGQAAGTLAHQGATAFLAKPFSLKDLTETVGRAVRTPAPRATVK